MSFELIQLQKELQEILQDNEENCNQIIRLEDQLELLRKEKEIIFKKHGEVLDKIKKVNRSKYVLYN